MIVLGQLNSYGLAPDRSMRPKLSFPCCSIGDALSRYCYTFVMLTVADKRKEAASDAIPRNSQARQDAGTPWHLLGRISSMLDPPVEPVGLQSNVSLDNLTQ